MKTHFLLMLGFIFLCGASTAQAETISNQATMAIPVNQVLTFDYSFAATKPMKSKLLELKIKSTEGVVGTFDLVHGLTGSGSTTWRDLAISYENIVSTASGLSGVISIANATGHDFSVMYNYTLITKGSFTANSFTKSYSAISPVPLPAALPFFGLSLLGLQSLRRKKS